MITYHDVEMHTIRGWLQVFSKLSAKKALSEKNRLAGFGYKVRIVKMTRTVLSR